MRSRPRSKEPSSSPQDSKKIGPAGAKLEQSILAECPGGQIRIIGPNCLGVMRPHQGFERDICSPVMRDLDTVGFLSQSGALCVQRYLDWSLRVNVGFSAFVSIGSMLDVGWGD